MAGWRDRKGRDFELPPTPHYVHEEGRRGFTLTGFLAKNQLSPVLVLAWLSIFLVAVGLVIQSSQIKAATEKASYQAEEWFNEARRMQKDAEQKLTVAEQKLATAAEKQETAADMFGRARKKLEAAEQEIKKVQQMLETGMKNAEKKEN